MDKGYKGYAFTIIIIIVAVTVIVIVIVMISSKLGWCIYDNNDGVCMMHACIDVDQGK